MVAMATHTTPIPGTNQRYNTTDSRHPWPFYYGLIGGALAAVIGIALSAWPAVFIGFMTLGLVILWILGHYGRINRVTILAQASTQDCLRVALWVAIVGAVSWVIGKLTGTLLVTFVTWMSQHLGLLMPMLAFALLLGATVGLLLAAGHRARKATIVHLAIFGIVVMFMSQQAAGIAQTPHEQTQQTCASQEYRDAFPEECE